MGKHSPEEEKTRAGIGGRIRTLRKQAGYLQPQLAVMISERCGYEKILSVSLISSWELGRRSPTNEQIAAMADIFNCTTAYIRCQTNSLFENASEQGEDVIQRPDVASVKKYLDTTNRFIAIEPDMYTAFNRRPVYLIFKNEHHPSQFALVNAQKKLFMTASGSLPFDYQYIEAVSALEPDYRYFMSKESNLPLNTTRLMEKHAPVYIKVTTPDKLLQREYNGWYEHNENHTCLINKYNGLVLPYAGNGHSYYAYSKENFDD